MGSTGNGSYVHNWTVIPKELVTAYDFVIENGIRLPAQRHLRACLCRLKSCVRFCCPSGQFYDLERRHCTVEGVKVPDYSRMEVAFNNGTQGELELATHFTVHIETPCDHMRAVTKDGEYLPWLLHEVGTVKEGTSPCCVQLKFFSFFLRRTVQLRIGNTCSPSTIVTLPYPRWATAIRLPVGAGNPWPAPQRSYISCWVCASGPMRSVSFIIHTYVCISNG